MKRIIAALSFGLVLFAGSVWLGFSLGELFGGLGSVARPDVPMAAYAANGLRGEDISGRDANLSGETAASREFERENDLVAKNIADGVLAMREGIQSPFRLPPGGDEDITESLLEQVERAIDGIRREIPEIFWISLGSYTIEWGGSREDREGDLTVYINYSLSPEEVAYTGERMEAVIADILSGAPDEPYKAVAYFHDWIVENTTYASELAGQDDDGTSKQGKEYAFNIDGVFLRGSAVCEGYSKAFKLLCDRAGIPCENVFGVAGEQSHSWNHVLLDGEWYLVDVTWDDPVGGEELLLHNYFLLGSLSEVDGQTVEEIYKSDYADYQTLAGQGYLIAAGK